MMRIIGYNSQRDNYDFAGKYKAEWQCMTTCAWMLMSYYCPYIKYNDDTGLAEYLDDVEARIGKSGIAERVITRLSWITGYTSQWWVVQRDGITDWLNRHKVKGKAVYDETLQFWQLPGIVIQRPVVLGTHKLGGLPGGHIILCVDYHSVERHFICHDPYGNANTDYKDANGAYVRYSLDMLVKHVLYGNTCRILYWRNDAA